MLMIYINLLVHGHIQKLLKRLLFVIVIDHALIPPWLVNVIIK